jgi:membrane associated rhomboid family serine protease
MFPLKDSIKSETFPFVNYLLILINIYVFFYQKKLGIYENMFILDYGLISQKFFAPWSIVTFKEKFIPLITYMFLHGGFFHLFSNMYFLFIFGDNIEDRLGHFKYILIYILFGVISGLTQLTIFSDSPYPLIGASGAVAGVMGAYFIFYPHSKIKTLIFIIIFITLWDIPAIYFLGFWFLLQFISGNFQISGVNGGGTAWWAHIGGFLFGIFYAIIVLLKNKSYEEIY